VSIHETASPGDDAPRLDIVVNNYNYAEYLRHAVDSALAQTYPETRVIVVDDGSTDESRDIIRSYGNRVLAVLKDNGGQASALNAGLARCTGRYVLFLDADDALAPDAAARIVATFATDSRLARVHFRQRIMDAEGRDTGALSPPPRLPLARGDLRRQTLRSPFDGAWLPTSGNAFRTAMLRHIAPIPEREYGRLGADWYLVHVSSLLGHVGAIDDPLGWYRVHAENGFTKSGASLDLDHLTQTVHYARLTRGHLHRTARRLGIEHDPERMASMCDVANRTLLRRLAVDRPTDDSRLGLLRLGARASAGRRDIGPVMKTVFLTWLATALLAPRPLVGGLGELFLFPERRSAINGLLGALHRS